MADLELILRYFAMRDLHIRNEGQLKQINLAKYLNKYMGDKTNSTGEDILDMKQDFITMIDKVFELLGKNAFKNLKKESENFASKINPAILMLYLLPHHMQLKQNINSRKEIIGKYKRLLKMKSFIEHPAVELLILKILKHVFK